MTDPAPNPMPPTCPHCGTRLPAPDALCPACLLQQGLEPNTIGFTASDAPNPKSKMGGGENRKSSWTPPAISDLAPLFPELDILRLLGRGGMGAVYQARQKNLDRLVALKILPPEMSNAPTFADRFTREAHAMARLNHPHIVTIHDFGTRTPQSLTSSFPYSLTPSPLYFFLMEFVDGMNLRALLDSGHISPKEALAIVPQICDALQYAHDHGIVHRDIKPENILLNKNGQVKIADFGLAKLMGKTAAAGEAPGEGAPLITHPSSLITSPAGTPAYMAPEQLSHPADVDHRADIYALGVVFYQMLTGELPAQRLEPPSRKVQIDVRLDQIVLRALEKSPSLRFQNATDFKTEIETVISTPAARPTSVPTSTAPNPDPGLQAFSSSASPQPIPADSRSAPYSIWPPLVGRRHGQAVINWPTLIILCGSALILGAVFTFILMLGDRYGLAVAYALFVVIAVPLGIASRLRRGFALPVDQLPNLDPTLAPAPALNPHPNPTIPPLSDLLRHAQQELRIPSIGLRVCALLNLLFPLVALVAIALYRTFIYLPIAGVMGQTSNFGVGIFVVILLPICFTFLLNLFLLLTAIRLSQCRSYNRCVAACILTFLAFPLNLPALAFGIWSLILLNRPDIKAAFDAVAPQSSPQAPPPPSLTPASPLHNLLLQIDRLLRRIRFGFILIPLAITLFPIVILFLSASTSPAFHWRELPEVWLPWTLIISAAAAAAYSLFFAVLRWRRPIPAALLSLCFCAFDLIVITEASRAPSGGDPLSVISVLLQLPFHLLYVSLLVLLILIVRLGIQSPPLKSPTPASSILPSASPSGTFPSAPQPRVSVRQPGLASILLPLALHTAALLGTFSFFVYVVPHYQENFRQLGAALPPLTSLTLSLTRFFQNEWFLALPFAFFLLAVDGAILWLLDRYTPRVVRQIWSVLILLTIGLPLLIAAGSLRLADTSRTPESDASFLRNNIRDTLLAEGFAADSVDVYVPPDGGAPYVQLTGLCQLQGQTRADGMIPVFGNLNIATPRTRAWTITGTGALSSFRLNLSWDQPLDIPATLRVAPTNSAVALNAARTARATDPQRAAVLLRQAFIWQTLGFANAGDTTALQEFNANLGIAISSKSPIPEELTSMGIYNLSPPMFVQRDVALGEPLVWYSDQPFGPAVYSVAVVRDPASNRFFLRWVNHAKLPSGWTAAPRSAGEASVDGRWLVHGATMETHDPRDLTALRISPGRFRISVMPATASYPSDATLVGTWQAPRAFNTGTGDPMIANYSLTFDASHELHLLAPRQAADGGVMVESLSGTWTINDRIITITLPYAGTRASRDLAWTDGALIECIRFDAPAPPFPAAPGITYHKLPTTQPATPMIEAIPTLSPKP